MQIMNGSAVYYLGKPPVVSALLPAFKLVQPTIVLSVPLIMEKIYKAKIVPAFTKNGFIKFLSKFPPTRRILCRKAGKELKKTFGGKLVFFGIGGSKVDPVVEKFMRLAKFPYAIGYGLTETAPLLAGSGVKITMPGTIGPLLPGLDLRIANANSKGVGEIVVKGPNVMKGYYKDPALTENTFTNENDDCGPGYFKTGDLGVIKKRKGLYRLILKGRSKNMILGPSGENIYPEDIEFVLNQHPFVNESLVVEDDTSLVALVNVDEEKVEAEAEARSKINIPNFKEMAEEFQKDIAYQKEKILGEIQYFVNSRTNSSSRIGRIEQVPEFEKTASQKIKRYLYDLRTKTRKDKKADARLEKEDAKAKLALAQKNKEIEVAKTENADNAESVKKVISDPTRAQSIKRIEVPEITKAAEKKTSSTKKVATAAKKTSSTKKAATTEKKTSSTKKADTAAKKTASTKKISTAEKKTSSTKKTGTSEKKTTSKSSKK